ncbi:hypothetical protein ACFSUI_11225 [Ralstonia solanacearum]
MIGPALIAARPLRRRIAQQRSELLRDEHVLGQRIHGLIAHRHHAVDDQRPVGLAADGGVVDRQHARRVRQDVTQRLCIQLADPAAERGGHHQRAIAGQPFQRHRGHGDQRAVEHHAAIIRGPGGGRLVQAQCARGGPGQFMGAPQQRVKVSASELRVIGVAGVRQGAKSCVSTIGSWLVLRNHRTPSSRLPIAGEAPNRQAKCTLSIR